MGVGGRLRVGDRVRDGVRVGDGVRDGVRNGGRVRDAVRVARGTGSPRSAGG